MHAVPVGLFDRVIQLVLWELGKCNKHLCCGLTQCFPHKENDMDAIDVVTFSHIPDCVRGPMHALCAFSRGNLPLEL
jgi:hypothetical protein